MSSDDDLLAWTREYTPVLQSLGEDHCEKQPFDGYTIALATHLEPKSGILIETLHTTI